MKTYGLSLKNLRDIRKLWVTGNYTKVEIAKTWGLPVTKVTKIVEGK